MSPKLTFGYLYDFRNPAQWQRPWAELYAEILDFVSWSESIGFSGAWVPEHHFAADGYMPSPLVALAAIAARTKTIKLGSAVALAPFYHPVKFAEESAVLDILANGRLELALAIGYRRREAEGYGVDFTKRGSRTDEFLEIVTRLWAGESVTFEGKHYQVKDAAIVPKPLRPRIPLFIGGFTEKALLRTAKFGDGYFGNLEIVDMYRDKLQAVGKDATQPRVRIQGLFTVVADDPEKAMEELAPYYHHVNNTYGEWLNEDRASIGVNDAKLAPMTLDKFKKSRILTILTPADAIKMFKKMQDRAPVEHYMMMKPPGLPAEHFQEYAQVFANKVLPAFL